MQKSVIPDGKHTKINCYRSSCWKESTVLLLPEQETGLKITAQQALFGWIESLFTIGQHHCRHHLLVINPVASLFPRHLHRVTQVMTAGFADLAGHCAKLKRSTEVYWLRNFTCRAEPFICHERNTMRSGSAVLNNTGYISGFPKAVDEYRSGQIIR